MPIRHMASKLEEIPAGAQNIRDVTEGYIGQVWFGDEPLTLEAFNRKQNWKLFSYDTHVGLCLFESERNGYHDSDFDMTVWNEAEHRPEKIEFASTRGWCGPCFGSHPDATPETLYAYESWQHEQEKQRRQNAARIQAKRPELGKTVLVFKTAGRNHNKVTAGTIADIFWAQITCKCGMYFEGRVGLRLRDGSRLFTNVINVMVL